MFKECRSCGNFFWASLSLVSDFWCFDILYFLMLLFNFPARSTAFFKQQPYVTPERIFVTATFTIHGGIYTNNVKLQKACIQKDVPRYRAIHSWRWKSKWKCYADINQTRNGTKAEDILLDKKKIDKATLEDQGVYRMAVRGRFESIYSDELHVQFAGKNFNFKQMCVSQSNIFN